MTLPRQPGIPEIRPFEPPGQKATEFSELNRSTRPPETAIAFTLPLKPPELGFGLGWSF